MSDIRSQERAGIASNSASSVDFESAFETDRVCSAVQYSAVHYVAVQYATNICASTLNPDLDMLRTNRIALALQRRVAGSLRGLSIASAPIASSSTTVHARTSVPTYSAAAAAFHTQCHRSILLSPAAAHIDPALGWTDVRSDRPNLSTKRNAIKSNIVLMGPPG